MHKIGDKTILLTCSVMQYHEIDRFLGKLCKYSKKSLNCFDKFAVYIFDKDGLK